MFWPIWRSVGELAGDTLLSSCLMEAWFDEADGIVL